MFHGGEWQFWQQLTTSRSIGNGNTFFTSLECTCVSGQVNSLFCNDLIPSTILSQFITTWARNQEQRQVISLFCPTRTWNSNLWQPYLNPLLLKPSIKSILKWVDLVGHLASIVISYYVCGLMNRSADAHVSLNHSLNSKCKVRQFVSLKWDEGI